MSSPKTLKIGEGGGPSDVKGVLPRAFAAERTRRIQQADPFALEVPPGVPVRHQSATEHLDEVVRAFERVSAFHRVLAKRSIESTQVHRADSGPC